MYAASPYDGSGTFGSTIAGDTNSRSALNCSKCCNGVMTSGSPDRSGRRIRISVEGKSALLVIRWLGEMGDDPQNWKWL